MTAGGVRSLLEARGWPFTQETVLLSGLEALDRRVASNRIAAPLALLVMTAWRVEVPKP